MKTKYTLVLLVIALLPLYSQPPSANSQKIDFLINISSKLLATGGVELVLVSNQEGKPLYHKFISNDDEEKDLLIQFQKEMDDKILLTIINSGTNGTRFNAWSYYNIENGTYLDQMEKEITERGLRNSNIEVQIEGVNNVSDFVVFAPGVENSLKERIENGTLIANFRYPLNMALFGLVKSNGEKRYRYFYQENLQRRRVNHFDYLKLRSCYKTKKVKLPSSQLWTSSAQTRFEDDEKPFYIYNSKMYEKEESSFIEFDIPTDEFDFFQIKAFSSEGNILEIKKEYDKIPDEISTSIEIEVADSENDFKLDFTTSENSTCFQAYYYFNSKEKEKVTGAWRIIGIDQKVSFVLPEIPKEVMDEYENIPYNNLPSSLKVMAYEIEGVDSYDAWILPNSLYTEMMKKEVPKISISKVFEFSEE